MNRRGFLGSILAAAMAPAIVRADSLMKVIAPQTTILAPEAFSVDFYPSELQQFMVTEVTQNSLTIDMITREALRIAHSQLTFLRGINENIRVGDVITIGGVEKRGDTIRIRKPNSYKRVGQ